MPRTEAQRRAMAKYEAKAYDKVLLRIRTDGELTRAKIQAAADAAGVTVNSYILDAVAEKMKNK